MGNIQSYRDLEVWQYGRRLVRDIYRVTKNFPKEETFALTSQMKRAAISVPSNIAEGYARHGTKDYIHFISIAIGSCAELDTQITLAMDLHYISEKDAEPLFSLVASLQKMLHKLRQSLKSKL